MQLIKVVQLLLKSHQSWVAGGLVVGAMLELSFRTVTARLLGTADFGQLAYLTSLLLVMGSIATLGAGNVVPRYLPIFQSEGREKVDTFIAFSLRILLVSGVFFSLALIFFNAFFYVGTKTNILLIAFFIPLYVISELVYAVNRGFLHTRQAIFQREVVRRGVPLLLIPVGLLMGMSLNYILIAIGVGLVVSIFIAGGAVWRARIHSRVHLPIDEINKYSLPLILSGALMQINARMDLFIANANLGGKDLGIYGASIVLPQLLAMLPGVFTFSLLPQLARCFNKNDFGELRLQFFRVSIILSLVGLGAAGALWVGSSFWVKVFFGQRYIYNNMLIDILILANWVMACIGSFGVVMLATGNTRQYLVSDISALLIGGGGQWFLSLYFGITGLAVGLLLTVVLLVLIRGAYVVKILDIGFSSVNFQLFFLVVILFIIIILIRSYVVDFSVILGVMLWVFSFFGFIYTFWKSKALILQ